MLMGTKGLTFPSSRVDRLGKAMPPGTNMTTKTTDKVRERVTIRRDHWSRLAAEAAANGHYADARDNRLRAEELDFVLTYILPTKKG